MHVRPIYGGSVDLVHIGFHILNWWGWLYRSHSQEGTRSQYRWLWKLISYTWKNYILFMKVVIHWSLCLSSFCLPIYSWLTHLFNWSSTLDVAYVSFTLNISPGYTAFSATSNTECTLHVPVLHLDLMP